MIYLQNIRSLDTPWNQMSNDSWFREFASKWEGQPINGDISAPLRGPVAMSYPEEVVHQHLCQHEP